MNVNCPEGAYCCDAIPAAHLSCCSQNAWKGLGITESKHQRIEISFPVMSNRLSSHNLFTLLVWQMDIMLPCQHYYGNITSFGGALSCPSYVTLTPSHGMFFAKWWKSLVQWMEPLRISLQWPLVKLVVVMSQLSHTSLRAVCLNFIILWVIMRMFRSWILSILG